MKNKLVISLTLIVAIVVFINLVSQQLFVRLDFSEDKRYTLSPATKNILKNLEEPITIKAYFSENLPPDVAKGRKDFKEMLIEYSSRSKGMLVYEFINPGEKEELEQEAMKAGVQPIMINVREKDQMKQQKAYLGAVLSMGDRKEIIPFIQPGGTLEYSLSTAIKKLTVKDKPSVGILQGHGEPGIGEMSQAYGELTILNNVEPLTLSDTSPVPERIKTLAIIGPKDSITRNQLMRLDEFLARGGRMFIAIGRVKGDLSRAYGSALNTGLETWLQSKGLHIDDNFVVDASCASVQVQQQQGTFRFMSSIQFPYIPVITKFAKHPISSGLESVIMQFISSMEYMGDSSKKFTPIAFSSDRSGSEKAPLYFNVQRQWAQTDFPQKHLIVAGTLEGKLAGNINSKIVVVANGNFPVNGPQERSQQLQPDNVNLLVNSIDWLSDDTGLIELRTKNVTSRPIKEMDDSTKAFLKWLNFLLPIILIIGYGFVRFQIKRNERIKRMEESYV